MNAANIEKKDDIFAEHGFVSLLLLNVLNIVTASQPMVEGVCVISSILLSTSTTVNMTEPLTFLTRSALN